MKDSLTFVHILCIQPLYTVYVTFFMYLSLYNLVLTLFNYPCTWIFLYNLIVIIFDNHCLAFAFFWHKHTSTHYILHMWPLWRLFLINIVIGLRTSSTDRLNPAHSETERSLLRGHSIHTPSYHSKRENIVFLQFNIQPLPVLLSSSLASKFHLIAPSWLFVIFYFELCQVLVRTVKVKLSS